ncbi:glutamate-5-semialdehyde dehydrogenase [Kandleria vitulina]|jgi:glutamate-5-semialdehyde dehydrogenase|uniref:Gamma-glutamyl phosphate reductase n=1 Tax=Kandleria vitulina TaxID=1630 RepID=A0A1H2QKP4_9FIRM|nr:glutamate-5-semialdehyde dehydrogenase [Kandleria vitulina]MEE0987787.1 glutamate-5-semialdehyde dehydrogenase [Kandleria vitulina]SDW07777.1 glutamate-5-semialdehyde dehydrogenase [Kandleria vitulina]HBG67541.1 glutamate-5-semialdehyde dehydrogenase [Kandleria vitulina]HCY53416.1 glutamate-5-semialdehyde dehydrogenase [Kandleria vitulina]
MNVKEIAKAMKKDAPQLASTQVEERNKALEMIKASLEEHKEDIFKANKEDLKYADENGVTPAVKKRLKFDENKLHDVIAGIDQLISLNDPLHKILLKRELDQDLVLTRISVPIGVIGVIFEARPDALVQISTLCIKSGNCAILKGGKETANTNKALFTLIKEAAIKAGLPENCLAQAEAHSEIDELLKCEKDVDLLIPRGSNAFVQYIMNNTKIPVMGHADGICHIYVDKDYDINKLVPIIIDAKTQYTAACNAVETILVNRSVAKEVLPVLKAAFEDNGVKMRGTEEVNDIISVEIMDDFHTEYLDLVVSIKLVDDVKEAIEHINFYGSHHTDAIITENEATAKEFMAMVDSAGVYWNVSTRFADGFRYGFGAEVGISTSKLHARGPVGLEGLITYKYQLVGKGQIVADYASGASSFHFKDL